MNILVVYPCIPCPLDRGTSQRVFRLLRALAGDHTIDLIALSEKDALVEHRGLFESLCRRVVFVPFEHPPLFPTGFLDSPPTTIRHWWLPQLAGTIGAMLDQHAYDMVHVCNIVMAQYFLQDHPQIPLRVDLLFHHAQHARMRTGVRSSLLHRRQPRKLRRFEHKVGRHRGRFVRPGLCRQPCHCSQPFQPARNSHGPY